MPSGAAASVTRSEPPRPIPHGTGPWGGPERRSVWRPPRTAFPDAWPPSSASSGPLAVRCCTKQSAPSAASFALYTTVNACRQEQRQAGEAQSLPCCVQPAKIQGIVPSRPGGAGLRGCSGRVMRAAGMTAKRNPALPFLRRKDQQELHQHPYPASLLSPMPIG